MYLNSLPLDFMGFDFIADIEFRVTSPYVPARTYGPPEDCYPAEGPEWEVDRISITWDDWGGNHQTHICTGALFDHLAEKFSDDIAVYIAEFGIYEDNPYID